MVERSGNQLDTLRGLAVDLLRVVETEVALDTHDQAPYAVAPVAVVAADCFGVAAVLVVGHHTLAERTHRTHHRTVVEWFAGDQLLPGRTAKASEARLAAD